MRRDSTGRFPHRPIPAGLALAFVSAALLLSPACGGTDGHGGTVDPNGNGNGNGQQQVNRRLAVVGPALIQLEAGGEATLQVALAQEDIGPVVDELVEFTIVGDGRGSSLPTGVTAATATDTLGIASVVLAAGTEEATFQVTASSPGANTVAFAVQVVRLQHRIAIVRTPNVRVGADGRDATVEIGAHSRVLARVRITDQFGRAVEGVQVQYSFSQAAQTATFDTDGSPILTNVGGEAQIAVDTGITLEDTFTVRAATSESAAATWRFTVQTDQSRICETDSDCGFGLYCRNSICQGTASCSNEEPVVECPRGYRCVVNECHPSFDIGCSTDDDCGTGFLCVDEMCQVENPQCETDEDCPGEFECRAGLCAGDAEGEFPNISGGWYTAHHFDIREALPSSLQRAADPIRRIHRALLGEFDLPFPLSLLEPLLEAIIDQYVPSWVTTVVSILDTTLTLMSDMRARGYKSIDQTATFWAGTEIWESFVFYYLPMCPGAPPADPTPDCARVDLFVEDLSDDISLGLKVHPFIGTVSEIGADQTATILVDKREVDLNIGRLLRWIIDELAGILTPYDDLESAVLAAADCQALGNSVESLTDGFLSASLVAAMCQSLLETILGQILDAITGVAFDLGLLEFEGPATVHEIGAGNFAGKLGYPNYESSRDGRWDGRFTRVVGGVPGGWHSSRSPIP
jgi:hypothetical protein